MDFQTRSPSGLNSDETGKVELVFVHNSNQSSVQLLTWDEMERLADVIEHALHSREVTNARTSIHGAEDRCPKHPAFEAGYCPGCGTSTKIG